LKKRDYAAEYKRRIRRAKKLGLSKSVARGHAKHGELSIKKAKALSEKFDVKVKPGTSIKDLAKEDNKHVFGRLIKRKKKGRGDDDASEYAVRLESLKKRDDGIFDWENEHAFVEQMTELGLTEREAYSNWFSPGGQNG